MNSEIRVRASYFVDPLNPKYPHRTALPQKYLLLARVRRVVLVVHADALKGLVVLAGDYEEYSIVVRSWVVEGELEGYLKAFGAA